MSKYIRVAEDDREYLTTYQEHCEEVAALQDDGYDFEGCILKQADTIEQLCDEFVSVRDNWHDHWDNFEEPKILCSESEIYGAIWTNKGLIYVAKLNDKGELELL